VTRARWLLFAAVATVGFATNAQITFEPYNVTTFAGVPTRSGLMEAAHQRTSVATTAWQSMGAARSTLPIPVVT
jgi:hypothetical protein